MPDGPEFARFAHTREIDPKHYAQMQWGLWITGLGLVRLRDVPPGLFHWDTLIERVLPNAEYFTRFDISVPAFSGMMIEVLEKFWNSVKESTYIGDVTETGEIRRT